MLLATAKLSISKHKLINKLHIGFQSYTIYFLLANLLRFCRSFSSKSFPSRQCFLNRSLHAPHRLPPSLQSINNPFIHSKKMSQSTLFDKSQFEKTISLVALKMPSKLCSQYLHRFQDHLFQRPRCKRVYNIENDDAHKLLLLSEKISSVAMMQAQLPADLIAFHRGNLGLLEDETWPVDAVQLYPYQLSYDHYNTEEILQTVLIPLIRRDQSIADVDSVEIPCSFEQAGHIAHMNIRDEMLPYKFIIGQIILDKNIHIKTVINKIGQIETEFRTFPLEVIAGEHDFLVTVKESNALFRFNFAEVYWNSRLQMEHGRIIQIIRDASKSSNRPLLVADMMAGVGPFAIPLSKGDKSNKSNTEPPKKKSKGEIERNSTIIVHANDLNPASYRFLLENMKLNHILPNTTLFPYNLDARAFLNQLIEKEHKWPSNVLMNLPQNAVEFLDVFIGCATRYNKEAAPVEQLSSDSLMPIIHVYAFSTHVESPVSDVAQRAATYLQCPANLLSEGLAFSGHIVRDVAPKKVMVCLTFTLPHEVAFR